MRVELVVFDMAGTTVYDGDAVNRCLARALETAGVTAGRDEINAVMGIAKPIAIRTVLEDHAAPGQVVTPAQVDATFEAFLALMRAYYESDPDVREIEGASDLFRQSAQRRRESGLRHRIQPRHRGRDFASPGLAERRITGRDDCHR